MSQQLIGNLPAIKCGHGQDLYKVYYHVRSPQAKSGFTKSSKYRVYKERTFGAITAQDRDTWIDRITQSLSIKLATFSMSSYTSYSR